MDKQLKELLREFHMCLVKHMELLREFHMCLVKHMELVNTHLLDCLYADKILTDTDIQQLECRSLRRMIRCDQHDDRRPVFSLDDKVIKQLSQIEGRISVVAIAGPYRTGKSWLMNQIARKKLDQGFAVGDLVEAKTKGIWITCLPHPDNCERDILFLDTEGLGDAQNKKMRHHIDCCHAYNGSTLSDKLKRQVYSMIEPNECLLSILVNSGALTKNQRDEIVQFKDTFGKVHHLLKIVTQTEVLVDALESAAQKHVAEFIRFDGNRPQTSLCWPLSSDAQKIFDRNRKELIERIDASSALLAALIAAGCIGSEHVASVNEETTSYDRSRKLLDIVARGSESQFDEFKRILCERQKDLVRPLAGIGGGKLQLNDGQTSVMNEHAPQIPPDKPTIYEVKSHPAGTVGNNESYGNNRYVG